MKSFVFVLFALLVVAAVAERPAVHNAVEEDPANADKKWKACTKIGKYGTVCGIITAKPSVLTVIGTLTWNGHKVFEYKFAANTICASEKEIIKLISDVPALAEFKPIIDEVLKAMGHIPAKVFHICLVLTDLSWNKQKKTVHGCAHVDINLACWGSKCAWTGTRKLGCFTI